MTFRQTFKGIFQFENQADLERAMAENQAEAMGADAMGLQDSFRGEGVMLLNIDAQGQDQDWEEMAVALATLAMHASKGFAYAVAHRASDGTPEVVEYYEANKGGNTPMPENSPETPLVKDDFFPLLSGSEFKFRSSKGDGHSFTWKTHMFEAHGRSYYFFQDEAKAPVYFSNYWDGTFYYKDKSLVGTVAAGTEEELRDLSVDDPYTSQVVYNDQGKPGDMLYSIWKSPDVFVIFTQEESEEVSLPYGNLKDCMKVRVELYHLDEDEMDVKTFYQYFSKGIGLVKWEIEGETLELVSFQPGS